MALNLVNKHKEFMRLALHESKKAIPICLPNPPVGCVLVKNDRVVAKGFTKEPGNDHAEVDAIKKYRGDLKDITAYITLEPCSFKGRTPSCAQMLATSGIKNVYVAVIDTDPRNNGAGLKIMKLSGIKVSKGLLVNEVMEFLMPYLISEDK